MCVWIILCEKGCEVYNPEEIYDSLRIEVICFQSNMCVKIELMQYINANIQSKSGPWLSYDIIDINFLFIYLLHTGSTKMVLKWRTLPKGCNPMQSMQTLIIATMANKQLGKLLSVNIKLTYHWVSISKYCLTHIYYS